jgi:hypothetical protein
MRETSVDDNNFISAEKSIQVKTRSKKYLRAEMATLHQR